jgi:regulatory protein
MVETGIYDKLARYCAYQDRCLGEVKNKLYQLKVGKENTDEYIQKLKGENYLDEERFVKAFVSGHLKKKWGSVKIKSALMQKGVAQSLVTKYLEKIEAAGYNDSLLVLAERKLKTIKTGTASDKKNKLYRFLLGKGYEGDKVGAVIKKLKL